MLRLKLRIATKSTGQPVRARRHALPSNFRPVFDSLHFPSMPVFLTRTKENSESSFLSPQSTNNMEHVATVVSSSALALDYQNC